MNDDLVAAARRAAEDVKARIRDLDDDGLDLLFREARSHNGWLDRPVSDDQLHRLYDLTKMGPTSSNCSPARFRFLRSQAAKDRLQPAIAPANLDKTMTAPVIAIIGHDLAYWTHLGRLFPQLAPPVKKRHEDDAVYAEETAFRNGSLQGAYLIIAARAIGLDCGPISGFDNAKVDSLFFAGTSIRSNFICNLGYADLAKMYRKFDRFAFDEVCEIV